MPTLPLTIVRQYHPDFCNWENRVRLAGGSVPTYRAISVNRMIGSAYVSGLRYKVKYLLGLHLTQSFTGCNVPIWAPSGVGNATIFNFVSGDWSPTLGLTGDGGSKYLDSGVNPSLHLSDLNTHIACYVTSVQSNTTQAEMGVQSASDSNNTYFFLRYTDNVGYYAIQNSTGYTTTSSPNITKLNIFTRSASSIAFYNQGTSLSVTPNTNSSALLNGNIFLFAINRLSSGPTGRSDRSMSMFTIGDSLSATEASQLNQLMEILMN